MPTYEYKCGECGIVIEYERSFNETVEPICCTMTMSRVWSPTPTIFKTNGFYKTGG